MHFCSCQSRAPVKHSAREEAEYEPTRPQWRLEERRGGGGGGVVVVVVGVVGMQLTGPRERERGRGRGRGVPEGVETRGLKGGNLSS